MSPGKVPEETPGRKATEQNIRLRGGLSRVYATQQQGQLSRPLQACALFSEKFEVHSGPRVFSGSGLTAASSFLPRFKDAFTFNRVSEPIVVWCFQLYVERRP